MNWLDFFVLTLAAGAIVDVWFNGSIFAEWRAYFQFRADEPGELPSKDDDAKDSDDEDAGQPVMYRVADALPVWVAELLNCPFCLSHHVPWVLAVLFFIPGMLYESWALPLKLPLYCLAATRLGNLINVCLPERGRYQR